MCIYCALSCVSLLDTRLTQKSRGKGTKSTRKTFKKSGAFSWDN